MGGSHYAALLNCVVEHCEARGRTVAAAALEADLLEDMRDGVADSGCRGKGEVNDTERNAESLGSFRTNELTHSCDLERSLFYYVGKLREGAVAGSLYRA